MPSSPIGGAKLSRGEWKNVMAEDLNHQNDRLRETINQLVESHPELETVVRDVASKQPPNATPEQVQANLQDRARAIIETRHDLEHSFGV
jgi:hypothetical protein